MDVEASPAASPAPNSDHVTSQEPEPEWMGRLRSVATILGGEVTVALHQEFLIRNNHTDLQIIENTKVRRSYLTPWASIRIELSSSANSSDNYSKGVYFKVAECLDA